MMLHPLSNDLIIDIRIASAFNSAAVDGCIVRNRKSYIARVTQLH